MSAMGWWEGAPYYRGDDRGARMWYNRGYCKYELNPKYAKYCGNTVYPTQAPPKGCITLYTP